MSAPYREGSVAVGGAGISGDPRVAAGGARTPSETSETFPLSSVPLSSEDGIPIPGVSDVSAPALADVSPSSPSPTGSGFPPESIFVPNVHTHAVRSLRGDFPACDAFAADVADVLARRSAGATPFHLVYLDHCGAVAQRAQQIWDVFSRHAVADGGVVAATFSTRGKRAGWTKAAAVAACARAFVEAADATGTNSWEMPRRGAGARRNRTRISRDSWTTPCASSRPGTGADRRRGSRRRPPRRPPRANPSPRLSANTPSPSPPRGTIISACATRSGGWTTRSGPEAPPSPTLRGATSRATRRMRRRDSPPLSRGGRRTSRRGRTDAPLCWTRGRVEGEDACVCTRSNASSGRTTRCASVGGARVRAARAGGARRGRGPVVVCLRERTRGYSPAWRVRWWSPRGRGGVGGSAGGGGWCGRGCPVGRGGVRAVFLPVRDAHVFRVPGQGAQPTAGAGAGVRKRAIHVIREGQEWRARRWVMFEKGGKGCRRFPRSVRATQD